MWKPRLVAWAAYGYLLALVGAILALRAIGERWWITGIAMFLPRALFAVPLPLLLLALLWIGPRRLLWTQLAAALLVLFPLMGFVLPRSAGPAEGAPRARILSCNVNSGYAGYPSIVKQLSALAPDIMLFQELFIRPEEPAELLRARFPFVDVSTQFLIASRFPIVSTVDPARLAFENRLRSPRFMEYALDTPLGRLTVFNVHTISSRTAFYHARGSGLRREILSGRIFAGNAAGEITGLASLRERQIEAVAERVSHTKGSVLVAGDLNLPTLDPALSHLSALDDGFVQAGSGFGYSYPNHPRWPAWMRLDRIFASGDLRFTRFVVLPNQLSDHLCVLAEVQRRK